MSAVKREGERRVKEAQQRQRRGEVMAKKKRERSLLAPTNNEIAVKGAFHGATSLIGPFGTTNRKDQDGVQTTNVSLYLFDPAQLISVSRSRGPKNSCCEISTK